MGASELHERRFVPGLPKEGDLHKLKHQRPVLFARHGLQDPVQGLGDQMTQVMGSVGRHFGKCRSNLVILPIQMHRS